jgi:nitrite reductase (cytochrome c-552)
VKGTTVTEAPQPTPPGEPPAPQKPSGTRGLLYAAAAVIVFGLTVAVLLLMQNISARQREAEQVVFRVVELDEQTVDPALWGRNFPRQYDSYLRTVDTVRTDHGGSDAFPKLDEFPLWRTIFAGHAFAVDYREHRGHAYMLRDADQTGRHEFPQPGACMHCHSSPLEAYRQAGRQAGVKDDSADPFQWEQVMRGFEVVCGMTYGEARKLVEHPVACIDCHDPGTMRLRVTRPAFLNGIRVLADSDDPVPHLPSIGRWRAGARDVPYDPNAVASRQEMRSFVCGQCHVEYYFAGENKVVTYPWHKGLKVEQQEAYYDEIGFSDWTHARSGASLLKAQHPEFEMWSQGIHARSGVSCADCHMPYVREGAIKVSSHDVRSPLLDVARACQVCHRGTEAEILQLAEQIQERTLALRSRAEVALVALIEAIEAAAANGADDDRLREARALQRQAQWRLDFVFAENSKGMHASQETARILGEAIDLARQGEISVLRAR